VLGDGSAHFEVRHINEATPAVGPSMKQQVAVPSQAKTVSDGEDGGCHGPLASVTECPLLRYNVIFFPTSRLSPYHKMVVQ
jgi:hypothetical protein